MSIIDNIQPLPAGSVGIVLVCQDCNHATAHAHYPNGDAVCQYCQARQRQCLGGCGLWIPVERTFCGGEGYMGETEPPNMACYFIVCRSCATEGPWSKVKSGAAHGWNRRVNPELEGLRAAVQAKYDAELAYGMAQGYKTHEEVEALRIAWEVAEIRLRALVER